MKKALAGFIILALVCSLCGALAEPLRVVALKGPTAMGLVKLMNDSGFHGPFTMELEGRLTYREKPEEQLAVVAKCVEYLRSIGAVE